MISVKLMGGLGNQLFQIFATIAYGLKYGHKIVFPYSEILTTGKERPTYWDSLFKSIVLFTTKNPKNDMTNEELYSLPKWYAHQHHFIEIQHYKSECNFILDGYFQSAKYFIDYQDKIYSMLRIHDSIQSIKMKYADLFCNDKYKIAMHFRMGDYKMLKDFFHIMPPNYYKKSLDTIIDCISQTQPEIQYIVYYFCEEEDNNIVITFIDELKTHPKYGNIEFVKISDSIVDWEQMLLMCCVDSNIIANSTFSWWGAYLNQNPNKIVCYPELWFAGPMTVNKMDDMFLPSWKKIYFL